MATAESYQDLLRLLEEYGTVLNTPARNGDLPRASERDAEVDSVLARLEQRGNRSLVLVGPSGSGKTAIVHEVVHRLNAANRHPTIVLETSTGMMMAETKYIGEWQTRVRGIVELSRRPTRAVLYFTDIYDLLGAGTHEKSYESVGTFLRPYVEKGDIAIVGECTPEQFRRGLERHPAFKKLFFVQQVQEPKPPAVRVILEQTVARRCEELLRHDGLQVEVPEPVQKRILELSRHYFPGQVYPGKAVQLLDQVLSSHADGVSKKPKGPRHIQVKPEDVIAALERSTGVPGLLLDDARTLDLNEVQKFFEERVLGQPEAIRSVQDAVTLIKAGLNDPGKPIGVYFFVGPTGVGKTELAKTLAEFIFGSADRLTRIDMSEFKDYHSYEKLIGNPQAGGMNPLQHGTLTAAVREQPFSVILLDEFEKAHPNIYDLFLQVFDSGRLTDVAGNTTDFTQTIVVMTSNLGNELMGEQPIGFNSEPRMPSMDEVTREMRKYFRPEFINRLDRVVVFRPLSHDQMRLIAQRELGKVLLRSGITRRNSRIDVDPAVVDLMLKEGFSTQYGARPLKRAVERHVLLPLARQLISITGDGASPLLRIHVADAQVRVRQIRDSESRKTEVVTKGITVVDSLRKKKVRMPVNAILARTLSFRERIIRLEEICEREQLRERKADLVKQTAAVTFWDHPQRARETLAEIHRIERLIDALDRVRKRTDDLIAFAEAVKRSRDPHAAAQLGERFQEVEHHLELVGYSIQCRGPVERCDAFVEIALVGDPQIDDDPVFLLAEMYHKWAASKGFSVAVVDEEPHPGEKHVLRAILLLEGISVYGILAGEAGLHEFVRGKSGSSGRRVQHVGVNVLPLFEDEGADIRAADLQPEKLKPRGRGKLVRAPRARLALTHAPTGLRVEAQSDRTAEDLAPVLEDYLRSRLQLQGRAGKVAVPAVDPDRLVRRYTLGPSPLVKDDRSRISTGALHDVLGGAIDEFLHARLAHRGEDGGAAVPEGET